MEQDEKHKFTVFEYELLEICRGWIGDEPGWEKYIHDHAKVLMTMAKKFE